MTEYRERKVLPHSAREIFDVVADVDSYSEFLPFCHRSTVHSREVLGDGKEILLADLEIDYKIFSEKFSSRVFLYHDSRIESFYYDGPFNYLESKWAFTDIIDGGCYVDFYVSFEFKSSFLQAVFSLVFKEIVKHMITAFTDRVGRNNKPLCAKEN